MNLSTTVLDDFPLLEELTDAIPITESLYLARSPYSACQPRNLDLLISKELERFTCSDTGRTGSLAELELALQHEAFNANHAIERTAS